MQLKRIIFRIKKPFHGLRKENNSKLNAIKTIWNLSDSKFNLIFIKVFFKSQKYIRSRGFKDKICFLEPQITWNKLLYIFICDNIILFYIKKHLPLSSMHIISGRYLCHPSLKEFFFSPYISQYDCCFNLEMCSITRNYITIGCYNLVREE